MKEEDERPDEEFEDLEDLLSGKLFRPGDFDGLMEGQPPPETENAGPRVLNEKEVKVVGVYEHLEQGMPPAAFVLLRDNNGRQVLIYIGRFEAYAISVALEGASLDRPMTHDLLKNMLDRLGGRVDRITIDDLWQDTYYAKITVSSNGSSTDIDARPSDAIALALRAKAPIYMAESILQQAAKDDQ